VVTDPDDLPRLLMQCAEDALYIHPRVRWVEQRDGLPPLVVTRDGRDFELRLTEVKPGPLDTD
jgi:hypothetical protein